VLKDLPITVLEALDAITADQICKKADC